MGREVRKVPGYWDHPVNENGKKIPLFDGGGFKPLYKQWNEENEQWERGFMFCSATNNYKPIPNKYRCSFIEWAGECPKQEEYMPDWPEEEKTHFQMYENVTEGTPISPPMETPEELAQWLANNNASSFGNDNASFDQWLRMINGPGSSVSLVFDSEKGLMSGVKSI